MHIRLTVPVITILALGHILASLAGNQTCVIMMLRENNNRYAMGSRPVDYLRIDC